MHEPWHRMISPGFGFFGAAIMMSFLGQVPTRMWIIALLSGPVMAYLGTDTAVSYLLNTFTWLPTGESAMIKLTGLVGCLIGLASIHIVGALAATGRRFSTDPLDPRK